MLLEVAPERIDQHAKTRLTREKQDVEALNQAAQSICSTRDLLSGQLEKFLAFLLPHRGEGGVAPRQRG